MSDTRRWETVDRADLVAQNPWWLDPTAIDRDLKLQRLGRPLFRREPDVLHTLHLHEPNVYTLRGPCQVGKSTAVKVLIQRLIRDGFPTAVADFPRDDALSDATYQTLWHIVAGDVERSGHNRAALKDLILALPG